MEVGGEGRLYTYRYSVTTRMTPGLRWAAMRAILMFHNCEGQSHKTVSTDHITFEEKGEPKQIRTEVPLFYQPNALPLGQAGSPSGHDTGTAMYATYVTWPQRVGIALQLLALHRYEITLLLSFEGSAGGHDAGTAMYSTYVTLPQRVCVYRLAAPRIHLPCLFTPSPWGGERERGPATSWTFLCT